MNQPLLSIASVSCERGYRQLFKDLCFDITGGEVVRIGGPNGSGKSTLLKVIAGLTSDYSGRILWQGEETRHCREIYHGQICFLGHTKAVKAALTARENLEWFQGLYPCKATVTIDDALKQVGLALFGDTLCGQLSAGQQQRVALARLILSSASLWILDEPFTAIDRQGVAEFEALIGRFAGQGGAVIITTHHHLQLPVSLRTVALGS